MKNKIFIFLSILSIVFLNIDFVYAFDMHEYDSSYSLFDRWGNDLPACTDSYYYRLPPNSNSYTVDGYPDGVSVCTRGRSPSLDIIKQYLPYHTRIDYKDRATGSVYSIMFATVYPLVVYNPGGSDIDYYTYNGALGAYNPDTGHIFSLGGFGLVFALRSNNSCIFTNPDTGVTANCYAGYYNNGPSNHHFWNNLYISDDDLEGNTTDMINFATANYDLIMNSDMYDATFVTNYVLRDVRTNTNLTNATIGFEFNTDSDLNLKYEEYALFIPKHNSSFNSYLWTDSNFVYNISNYNSSVGYTDSSNAGFDEISFGYLNGFNWFRWDFGFNSTDLANGKVLRIYNHNESRELNLKYFSTDFEVRKFNKNSSSYTYNGVTYTNDWEYLNNVASQHTINNNYSVDMFNDFDTYTRNLPRLVRTFSSAFVFIGTLISNAFNLFNSEILTYFYVLFGLMLIMLLISILM